MYLLQKIVYQIQYKLLHIITIKTEIIINYTYSLRERKGNVLFNDALNTFYLGYMEGRKYFI